MKNKQLWLRNIIAYCLVTTVFFSSSLFALAKSENKSLAGEIIISGQNFSGNEPSVMLNGENVLSGRTFFSSGVIATSKDATATVRLGKLGYITVNPNSILSLSLSDNNISGTLSAGEIQVFNNEGVNVNIERAEAASVTLNNQTQTQTTTATGNSYVIPLLIFAGAVTTAVVYTLATGDDDNIVSPLR